MLPTDPASEPSRRATLLARLTQLEAKLARQAHQLADLARAYDPNQPRVSRGNPDGGRWTSTGGGGGGGDSGGFDPSGSVSDEDGEHRIVRDETGGESWHSRVETRTAQGDLARETVFNRDGGTVRSVFATEAGQLFDARHTVALPDGQTVEFETVGSVQTVRIGADGPRLTEAVWTPQGPELRAQSVFAPAVPAGIAAVEAGLTLFGVYAARQAADRTAVFGFRARLYVPGDPSGDAAGIEPIWVGWQSRDEVDAALEDAVPVPRGVTGGARIAPSGRV